MSEWIRAEENPTEPGYFLCRVLVPERGGRASRKYAVLWFDILDKKWVCDEMIVTHWMPLPEPPEEENHDRH